MIDGFTVSCLVTQGTFNSEYEVKIAPLDFLFDESRFISYSLSKKVRR